MNATLELRDVSVRLGRTPVLRGCSFAVRSGEVVALAGPNGAGKSTALRTAAGLLKPSGGTVLLDGRPLGEWQRRERAGRIAYLPQFPTLPALFRVRDAVAMGRAPYIPMLGHESEADRAAAARALGRAGLAALAERPVDELSGGSASGSRSRGRSPRSPHCCCWTNRRRTSTFATSAPSWARCAPTPRRAARGAWW